MVSSKLLYFILVSRIMQEGRSRPQTFAIVLLTLFLLASIGLNLWKHYVLAFTASTTHICSDSKNKLIKKLYYSGTILGYASLLYLYVLFTYHKGSKGQNVTIPIFGLLAVSAFAVTLAAVLEQNKCPSSS